MSGPPLSPHTPSLDAMRAYVRAPKGQMPVYSERILPAAEFARIHAYLESLPPPLALEGIALLARADSAARPSAPAAAAATPPATAATAATDTSATALAHGQAVYAAHCASCHGERGSGGVGPALRNVARRLDASAIDTQVRAPAGAMPALFPSVIDERDVHDVVRYVATLK